MSLIKNFDIAGSAMKAQSVRLNTVASNMANAQSVASSPEQAYRARLPVFRAVLDESNPLVPAAAVQVVEIRESQAPPFMEYQPNHPLANAEGYVFKPNISLPEQMADMISASQNYASNVEVMRTSRDLMLKTLRIGQS